MIICGFGILGFHIAIKIKTKIFDNFQHLSVSGSLQGASVLVQHKKTECINENFKTLFSFSFIVFFVVNTVLWNQH
jgi:hypothetical protein